ncbi:MAG: hypothetical protein HOL48_03645 [Porticoccaceae bacterium]|nr:hypothetical protein [Porticoccaceae bacterium]
MKDKLVAAGIHLGISLLVAGLILVLLFVIWFPSPLMSLGAVEGVQLILLVDLAIGPLLTLIVFKKGKASLVLDLSVIVALQIAALAYGLTAVYSQTPSYLVLTYEGLYLVTRHEEKTYLEGSVFSMPEGLSENPARYAGKIPLYSMREPEDIEARSFQNNGFMFGESLPYYLNLPMYQSFDGFVHLIREGTATNLTIEGQSCTQLALISVHGSEIACLQIDGSSIQKID